MGKQALDEATPEWAENLPEGTTVEQVSSNSNTGEQVQLQKLKLMQELMDQLKSM